MRASEIKKIREYFAKINTVVLVYLYGSYASGQAKGNSDIDLAILVDEKKANSLDVQLRVMNDLSSLLNKEVEVQNLHAVDIRFAHRVITQGKLLFVRDIANKVFYETYIFRQYFDLKPLYDDFYLRLAERARRGFIGRTYEELQESLKS